MNAPVADFHLNDLIAHAKRTGQKIYALAFHVDYWSPSAKGPM